MKINIKVTTGGEIVVDTDMEDQPKDRSVTYTIEHVDTPTGREYRVHVVSELVIDGRNEDGEISAP